MQLTKFAAVVLIVAAVCLAVTAGCAVTAPADVPQQRVRRIIIMRICPVPTLMQDSVRQTADGTSRGMQIPPTGITADADTIFFFFVGGFFRYLYID